MLNFTSGKILYSFIKTMSYEKVQIIHNNDSAVNGNYSNWSESSTR